jgi:uncharacterized membrane protein YphA (DoxX/SURF4 family)
MPVRAEAFALPLLRAGIVVLFLWFGFSQITDPGGWVSWVPPWTEALGLGAETIVFLNGVFEVLFGLMLAAGFYTRLSALLLSLHLLFIAVEIGYNDIGIRDFALAIATSSLVLFKPDQYTLDNKLSKE